MRDPVLWTFHADLTKFALPPEWIRKIDVAVTSPPYKTDDGYTKKLMDHLGVLVEFGLKPGGRFFMNFGQLRDDFNRVYEAREAIVGDAHDLHAGQTIIWAKSVAVPSPLEAIESHLDSLAPGEKVEPSVLRKLLKQHSPRQLGHYQPLRSEKLLNYCHEMIFTFYKGHETPIDRLALGVPYSDKTNLGRGKRGKNGDLHCGGDIWFVPYKTTGRTVKKKHRYEFPEPLVERCLKLSGVKPGGVVLEPFCGSGTTAVVAKRLGLSCVTIDIDEDNLIAARERWEAID